MSMKTKIFIAIGVLGFLYLRKKKKDKESEKIEQKLKVEGLSTEQSIDIIRYKLNEFISSQWSFFSEEKIHEIVMSLTSDLENYQVPELPEILDYNDPENYD